MRGGATTSAPSYNITIELNGNAYGMDQDQYVRGLAIALKHAIADGVGGGTI